MSAKERLTEYIERDEIYQDYKKDKLMNAGDFDKFCIQHCKDIEEILEENKQLKDNWNELREYCEEVISTDNELYGTDLLDKMQELEQGDGDNDSNR
jgi:hypothetical protein